MLIERKQKKSMNFTLKTDYPYIKGIKNLNLKKEEIVCYRKYSEQKEIDKMNCEECNYVEDCKRDTILTASGRYNKETLETKSKIDKK